MGRKPCWPSTRSRTTRSWQTELAGDRETANPLLQALNELVADLTADLAALQSYLPRGGGSNNWVIAGSRTAVGKPILASDPHLAPSRRRRGTWCTFARRNGKRPGRCSPARRALRSGITVSPPGA